MSEDYILSEVLPMCDYSQKGAVFSNIWPILSFASFCSSSHFPSFFLAIFPWPRFFLFDSFIPVYGVFEFWSLLCLISHFTHTHAHTFCYYVLFNYRMFLRSSKLFYIYKFWLSPLCSKFLENVNGSHTSLVFISDFEESWTTRRHSVNAYPIEVLFSANGFKD